MNSIKITLTACIVLTFVSACQPGSPLGEPIQALPPMRIEYTNWWGDYTMVIAEEKGFFEKHNVNVEPVYYADYPPAIPDMAAGLIDGMLISIGDAIQMAQNSRIVVVAVYDNGGSSAIVATPDINRVEDLKGKNIGIEIGTTFELLAVEMLKSGGLTRDDVTFVDLFAADVPSQLGTTIQAGLTWEPFLGEALTQGNKILYKSDDVYSSLFPDVIIFQETTLQRQPGNVRNFLKAWFEAVEFRKANPDESRAIISLKLDIPPADITGDAQLLNLEDNQIIFSNLSEQEAGSISYIAQLHTDFLITLGTIGAESDFESIFDPSYLQ